MIDDIIQCILSCIRYATTPIFLFHSTLSFVPKNIENGLHNVEPEIFYQIMKWINSHYDIVSIDELFKLKNLKRKAAVTFDDGYLSVFEQAVPILIDLKIPSTIFINGCNFNNEIFWRDKIRYIINNGFLSQFFDYLNTTNDKKYPLNKIYFYTSSKMPAVNSKWLDDKIDDFFVYLREEKIPDFPRYCISHRKQIYHHPLISYGNHTYRHYVLSSLTKDEQKNEINLNHNILLGLSKNISRVFSVPFGGLKHINNETLLILEEENYRGLLFSNSIVNRNLKNFYGSLKSGDRLMVPNAISQFQKQFLKGYIRAIFN